MLVSEIPLKGAHNLENALAAVCAGALMGCASAKIREAVAKFKAVEHRLEYVATVRGVEYYNDSKATNVDATIKALESFPANIHLILGGKDKGSDYSVLNDLLRQAGEAGLHHWRGGGEDRVADRRKTRSGIVHAGTLESAVQARGGSCPARGCRFARARLRQLRPVPEL